MGINPKMNVIAWVDFELTYFEATVHLFKHYPMESSPYEIWYAHSFDQGEGFYLSFTIV